MIITLFFLMFLVAGVVGIVKYRAYLLDDLSGSSSSASRDALFAELIAHGAHVDGTTGASASQTA
jgi:hypothetical protein